MGCGRKSWALDDAAEQREIDKERGWEYDQYTRDSEADLRIMLKLELRALRAIPQERTNSAVQDRITTLKTLMKEYKIENSPADDRAKGRKRLKSEHK